MDITKFIAVYWKGSGLQIFPLEYLRGFLYYTDNFTYKKITMNLSELQKIIVAYRDERDRKQFHNPKDMAISICLEAAEILEIVQWKSWDELNEHIKKSKEHMWEELSDVLYNILLLAYDLDIDLIDAFHKKMTKNALKYPIEKAKGSSKKYTEL